jgi:hypothetical protein
MFKQEKLMNYLTTSDNSVQTTTSANHPTDEHDLGEDLDEWEILTEEELEVINGGYYFNIRG